MGKTYQNIRRQLSTLYDEREAQAITFVLLEDLCQLSQNDVLIGRDDEIKPNMHQLLDKAVARMMKGEPVQYVTGWTKFCGLSIHVGPEVLIPRPETEELVTEINKLQPQRVLDIGTGSGCIALAVKHQHPQATVTAMDISSKALQIAEQNAELLSLQIYFEEQDILKAIPKPNTFDLIVSNPPYICESEADEMEHHVLDFEPPLALFVSDEDPLLFYRAIIHYASTALTEGGTLAFEINRAYGKEVASLMEEHHFVDISIKKDMFNNDRMVFGRLFKQL